MLHSGSNPPLVPSYTKCHLFVAVGIVTACNNIDGDKLVMLSSIALHYGDIYIVSPVSVRAKGLYSTLNY